MNDPTTRHATVRVQITRFIDAVRNGDDATVEAAVLQLSRSRRYLAPLAFVVSAFVMLFQGVRLLVTNWRLTLVQVLPAMWIWLAMLDLKAHTLHGRSFNPIYGPLLIPVVLLIAGITAAGFFLNAVFAFAIISPGKPEIRPAFARAWSHGPVVIGTGFVVGLALAFSTTIVVRWSAWWFAISLSIVVAVMMTLYVSMPARIIGVKSTTTKPEAVKASVVGGILGATICTPPYMLGRIGLLLLGTSWLWLLGVFLLAFGLVLQAGATGAVKAVKFSAKLLAGDVKTGGPSEAGESSTEVTDRT